MEQHRLISGLLNTIEPILANICHFMLLPRSLQSRSQSLRSILVASEKSCYSETRKIGVPMFLLKLGRVVDLPKCYTRMSPLFPSEDPMVVRPFMDYLGSAVVSADFSETSCPIDLK